MFFAIQTDESGVARDIRVLDSEEDAANLALWNPFLVVFEAELTII